jgi:hypothetical protein
LGSLPPGNGAFQFTAAIAVYPDEATLLPIARAYSEYRFRKFTVKLIPRCPTSTLGTKWAGFGYSVPFTPADYAQVNALAGVTVTQAYEREGITSLVPSNRAQNWYPVLQSDLTSAQLGDPNIVQAYLYLGTQSVQSGVTAADIHVSYTVEFRGPVANLGTSGPAIEARVVRGLSLQTGMISPPPTGGEMLVSPTTSSAARRTEPPKTKS